MTTSTNLTGVSKKNVEGCMSDRIIFGSLFKNFKLISQTSLAGKYLVTAGLTFYDDKFSWGSY